MINIRKAAQENANDYAACVISCWQSAYRGIVPDDYLNNMSVEKDRFIEKYKNVLTDPGDCEYYYVEQNKKIIGFITICKNNDVIESEIGEIWAIYLIEKFRGAGHGKIMLDFAIDELKKANREKIYLWVFEENVKARRFYEKNNLHFDGTKRVNDKYGKPLVQLRYALSNN